MVRGIFFVTFLGILLVVGGLSPGSATAGSAGIDPLPLPVWGDELLVPGAEFYTLGAPAMALDPDGRPHFVYGLNHLFHTWYDGVDWQSERIDTSPAWQRESVIAIDDAGTIFIADYENDDLSLRILESGGSWQKVSTPFPHLVNFSMSLDRNGRPHIIAGPYFYYPNLVFLHGTYGAHGWTLQYIPAESAAQKLFSITIDRNDQPVILFERYGEAGGVWVARQRSGTWQYNRLGSGCVLSGSSLVLDDKDKAYALFSEDCDRDLHFAQEIGLDWQTLAVSSGAQEPALALDHLGQPHVVYSSPAGQVYASLKGLSWETVIIRWGEYAAWNNQLLLDSKDAAHILSINWNLQYATNGSGEWEVSTPASVEFVGWANALAIDAAGSLHILFHEYESGDLYWASNSAGGLEMELLANVDPIGLELALDIDAQDRPLIAYIDQDREELVTGVRQEGVWKLETVGPGFRQLSMAVDRTGRPHLAVIDSGTIFYWTREGDDWIGESIEEVIASEASVSLALDSQDRPYIAYTGDDGSFLAGRQGADSWTKEPLPFEKVENLVFGPEDQPYLLYSESYWVYDGRFTTRFDSLWFAEYAGEDWSVELLWEDPDWDIEADLIVQNNNPVRVALRSAFGEHVYLEHGDGGAWSSEEVAWPGGGDISMAIGQDGQPRLLTEDGSSLFLSTREIVWLENHSLLPVLVP
jgi:hypothetical protein